MSQIVESCPLMKLDSGLKRRDLCGQHLTRPNSSTQLLRSRETEYMSIMCCISASGGAEPAGFMSRLLQFFSLPAVLLDVTV